MSQHPSPSWIETAHWYASEFGWRVLPVHHTDPRGCCTCGIEPCEEPGRHARLADWRTAATAVEQEITSWSTRWKDAHVGIATGPDSGVVALEVDRTMAPDGLASLENAYDRLPLTSFYQDGRQREIHLFRHPGFPVSGRRRVFSGITLVADAAFVVAPPFLPGETRSSIQWRETPGMRELALPPRWLLEAAGVTDVPAGYGQERVDASRRDRARVSSAFGPPESAAHGEEQPLFRTADEASELFSTAAELPLDVLSDTRWVAKPWAAAGSLSVVLGTSKLAGKTTWLLNLVRSTLTGSRFLYAHCTPSPVVYLTEQNPHTFSRALQDTGIIDLQSRSRLTILNHQQVRLMAWADVMKATVQECKARGAKLLVIDALDCFAGISADPAELSTPSVMDPIAGALEEGIAVVVVYQQFHCTGDLADAVPQLGKLASAADVIVSLRRTEEGRSNVRCVEALSRFSETPPLSYIALKNGRYQPVERPYGGLFAAADAPDEGAAIDTPHITPLRTFRA